MNTNLPPLQQNTLVGEYQITGVLTQKRDYIDYSAVNTASGAQVILREFVSDNAAQRETETGMVVPLEGYQEAFDQGRATFISAANRQNLLGSVEALGNIYLAYAVPVSSAPAPQPSPPLSAGYRRPVYKKSAKSGGAGFLVFLIVLLLLGGGGYFVWENYKESEEKIKAAQLAEQQRLERQKEELEKQAEEERIVREKAEADRLAAEEAARKKKEEEDRLKNEADNAKEPVIAVVEEPTPVVDDGYSLVAKDDDPRLKIYEKSIVLVGRTANSTENRDLWKKAIDTAFETNRYDKFRDFLGKAVKENADTMISFGKFDVRTFNESPYFRLAMKDYRLLSLMNPQSIVHIYEIDRGEEFYRSLFEDKDGMNSMLLRSLTGEEKPTEMTRIMDTWLSYWVETHGEAQKKYLPLSLACALVDPSHLGPIRTKYAEAATMDQVYKFFYDKAESNMLKADITRMKPTDLVHVVDVRLPLSEMEWSIAKMRQKGQSQKKWGETYSMVKYRMDQASNRRDIYKGELLEEILDQGGTCMDQAYFATSTAKSNGIPAAYVTGDGKLGPHAWFTYMTDDKSWATAGGIGYTSGKTKSPQSGKMVHEMLYLTAHDKRISGDRLDQTRDLIDIHKIMWDLDMHVVAMDILNKAQLNTPEHPLPWEATVNYYSREGNETTLEQWEVLADTLRRRFKKRPDYMELAQYVEDEYIFPFKNDQETTTTLARQRRQLERTTKEGRSDLSVDMVKRQGEQLAKIGKYDELNSLYRKALRDYGTRTDAFKGIIQQYFDFASQAPEKERQKRMEYAVKEIDRAFQKYANTGSSDLFVTKQEVGLQNTIAGFYRKIGDEKKANQLVKTGENRLNRVQRGIRQQND